MASILATTNDKTAMTYVGEGPWNCLGTKLDQPATACEAFTVAGLDYWVELIHSSPKMATMFPPGWPPLLGHQPGFRFRWQRLPAGEDLPGLRVSAHRGLIEGIAITRQEPCAGAKRSEYSPSCQVRFW